VICSMLASSLEAQPPLPPLLLVGSYPLFSRNMQAMEDTVQSWVGLVLMAAIREFVVLVLPTTRSTTYCSTQSPQGCSKGKIHASTCGNHCRPTYHHLSNL
jgi:hypothetical protein